MNEFPNLEAAFKIAVEEHGAPYAAARAYVVSRAETAVPFLQARQASPEWKASWVADLLVGWIRHPDLFHSCTAAILGKLEGPPPITGTFPAKWRMDEVVTLGLGVTPRLLEMALKTSELGDVIQTSSIFGAMVRLEDPRVVLPLIDALQNSLDATVREWAASTLGPLNDQRAVPPLLVVLRDASNTDALRASAALSLGALNAKAAIPDLEAIARDKERSVEFRKAAAMALADLKSPQSAEVLLPAVHETDDLSFQLVLLDTIAKIGTVSVVPGLQSIASSHGDEAVREAAGDALELIAERSIP